MKTLLAFLGRVCLSLIFIMSAVGKILNWEGSHQFLVNGLCNWLSMTASMPMIQPWLEMLISHSPFLLILAAVFEALGGLLIFLGIKVRFGAFLLLLFIIPTTILLHAFWMAPPSEKELQMIMFLKNISIMGGLLLLLAYGGKNKTSKPASE